MPLEFALKTLNDQALWFTNPLKWKDPFEKRFIEATYIDKNGNKNFYKYKNRIFCLCATKTNISEAFWNTYSQKQIGIEFRINRKKLLKVLEKYTNKYDIYIGDVEYMKTVDIKRDLHEIPFKKMEHKIKDKEFIAKLLLLKRIAYEYENEIRIILVKKNVTNQEGMTLKYTCENTTLIDSIFLDPSIGENTTKLLKDTFENIYKFSPITNSKKAKNRVLKSQLYKKQNQSIIKF